MKDQNSVDNIESKIEKYNRAVDLFIESVHNLILHLDPALIIRNVIMS